MSQTIKINRNRLNSLIKESIKSVLSEEKNKKEQYLHMDISLRRGGRNAVKMSVAEFKDQISNFYKECAMQEDLDVSSRYNKPTFGHFVYHFCYKKKSNEKNPLLNTLYKDLYSKYQFDTENIEAVGDVKMSKKGVPYIECYAGGDWECPVCFFIYYDGSKFRGYIPLKGNAINLKTKSAFQGHDDENDYIREELGDDTDVRSDNIKYNVNACLEDFMERIDVKGTYKKKPSFDTIEKKYEEFYNRKVEEQKKREEDKETEY